MGLSEFRANKFTHFFKHMDLDNDDHITENDFVRYAERIQEEKGWDDAAPELVQLRKATDAWWADLCEQADDGDGQITLEEFLDFFEDVGNQTMENGAPPVWAVELCTSTHALLDLNGDGTVNADEYGVWLRAIGADVEPAEAFERIDLNKDGVVTLPELFMLFGQFVLSEDPADPGNYVMTGSL